MICELGMMMPSQPSKHEESGVVDSSDRLGQAGPVVMDTWQTIEERKHSQSAPRQTVMVIKRRAPGQLLAVVWHFGKGWSHANLAKLHTIGSLRKSPIHLERVS